MTRQQGFTLIEVLIATVVFAIMSVMAVSGLSVVLNSREQVDEHADRLAELQKVFTIIGRDIEQTVNRRVRDNYATELLPLSGGAYGSTLLEFSRTGLMNPMGQRRSHLMRVGYMLSEGKLVRLSWFAMDRSFDTLPYESPMLSDVKAVELRFMDKDHKWLPQWPDMNLQQGSPVTLPRAVEVTLELEDWGRIRRIFEVVG